MRHLELPGTSARTTLTTLITSLARRITGPALVALAVSGAVALAPSEASAQSKIAVVDVRRAVLETEEGLRVQATLKKLFDSRQVEIDGKQRALAQDKEELDREVQGGKTSKEALQRKFEALQKRAMELQSLTLDYQREMQRKEGELTTPILQRILGLVRRIASQEGYEMVLEKSAVPYYRADLEVTDRAIQLYNGGQSGETPAPAGKTPASPTGKAPASPTGAPATAPAPAPAKPQQPAAQPKKK